MTEDANGGKAKTAAEADDALRWELYNDHKKQAWEDIQSSTDSYDQSLLTLSSGALGLSIAFIKDIVPAEHAMWLCLLYFSWVCFGCCILVTVISFQLAIATQREHLGFCWKFYVERDDSFRDKHGICSKLLRWCTISAGSLFVIALACTIVFAVGNLARYSKMPKDTKLQEGRAPVSMTPIPVTPVPPQPAPAPATPNSKAPKKD